jgi:hypothetical protein
MPFSIVRVLPFAIQVFTSISSVATAATPCVSTPVPSYVLTYAPYIYLSPNETYWPSDVATHIQHVLPSFNYTALASGVTLATVAGYNASTFLTSKDDVTGTNAPTETWLLSAYGKPDANNLSAAPVTIVAVNKPSGIVGVLYFLFY